MFAGDMGTMTIPASVPIRGYRRIKLRSPPPIPSWPVESSYDQRQKHRTPQYAHYGIYWVTMQEVGIKTSIQDLENCSMEICQVYLPNTNLV
jgi:hypothetical protein